MSCRRFLPALLVLPLAAGAQNLLTQNPGFESGGPHHGWAQAMDQTYSFSGWTTYKHQWSFNRSQGVLNGDGAEGARCFDAVVIGCGQNDQFGGGPWAENYRQFVILLRKVYPRAQIICTHTSMTGDQNWFQAAIEPLLADRGPGGVNADGRIHMLLQRPSGRGDHPSPQYHHDMAHGNRHWRGLVDFIEDEVGWGLDAPAGTPAEVREARPTPGGVRFEVAGGEDCAYVLESSTNLVDWLPALTNRSRFEVVIEPAAEPQRCFRAVYAGRGAEFTYSPPAPLAPAGLRLTAVSSNTAALAWTDRSANEHGFTLERRLRGGSFTPFATLPANAAAYTDTGLAALTVYGYRVRAFNAAGPSAWSAELRVETDAAVLRAPDAPADVVTGLRYRYFEGAWDRLPNFAALTPKASGAVADFTLAPRLRNDEFAFEFTGFLEAPADGAYTLNTASDDGSQLFIGATRVVDNDGLHGVQTRSGRIALEAGRHALRVTMFEKGGGETLEVRWAGPGFAEQVIPASRLFRLP